MEKRSLIRMESISTSRPSNRPSRGADKEKEDKAALKLKIPPPQRNTRYKEKFQALRERYDQVTAVRDDHKRDLDIAAAKIKKLQEENDLLLDAINLSTPNLINMVSPAHERPDLHLMPDTFPRENAANNDHAPILRPSHSAPQAPRANGNSNGRSNGTRHRVAEEQDIFRNESRHA